MKKIVLVLTLFFAVSGISGCAKKTSDATTADTKAEESKTETDKKIKLPNLTDVLFDFSSGAGGWGTELEISEDGAFRMNYHDSEMGSTGDGYPNGTIFVCSGTGHFTEPEKVDDYTLRMKIKDISYDKDPGKEEILEGIRFVYTTPYGIDGDSDFYFYLIGKPVKDLPEAYKDWVHFQLNEEDETLPFYGIYNTHDGESFSSYVLNEGDKNNKIDESSEYGKFYYEYVRPVEKKTEEISKRLENDSLDQLTMNKLQKESYELWNDLLNCLWHKLSETKPKEEMDKLRAEQRKWIKNKEAAVEEAAAGLEGGSMMPMVQYGEAAIWTKNRVYSLMDMIDN